MDDFSRLPIWRQQVVQQFRQIQDRLLSTETYLLLCEGLLSAYGIEQMPSFTYGAHGKPFLREFPDIQFNLSHCRDAILCAIDDSPVGCDIESIGKQLSRDLCQYCSNEEEYSRILEAPIPQAEFTKLWTQKEAYLKYTGQGIVSNLPDLFRSRQKELQNIELKSKICIEKNYAFTLCSQKIL